MMLFRSSLLVVSFLSLFMGQSLEASEREVPHLDWLNQNKFELAGNYSSSGPPSSYNSTQKYNFYLGQIHGALKVCGEYSTASEIRALQTDRSAFARGEATMANADFVKNCFDVKRMADRILGKE